MTTGETVSQGNLETLIAAYEDAMEKPDPPFSPRGRLSDSEIQAWADRHDIAASLMDLRCMVEDALSLRSETAPTAPLEMPDGCSGSWDLHENRWQCMDCKAERQEDCRFLKRTNDKSQTPRTDGLYGSLLCEEAHHYPKWEDVQRVATLARQLERELNAAHDKALKARKEAKHGKCT